MEAEEILLTKNIKEFIVQAKKSTEDNSFNSAATLYFKALTVMTDLMILKNEGFIPSNHTERFKILKEKYREVYKILDKTFPIYQNSYRFNLTKKDVEVFEDDIKEVAKIAKFEIKN